MIDQLTWDTEDGEPLIDAVVMRCTVHQGQMVLLYCGTDRYTQQSYDGRINLQMTNAHQSYSGTYATGTPNVAFSLTGTFIDTEFTNFEGRWVEPGWTSKFSF